MNNLENYQENLDEDLKEVINDDEIFEKVNDKEKLINFNIKDYHNDITQKQFEHTLNYDIDFNKTIF